MVELRRYRFGPLERRGLVGSLRLGQVAVVAGGLVLAVFMVRTAATGFGVLAALLVVLLALGVAFWPVAGRSAEEWAPVALRSLLRDLRGRSRYRSPAPTAGIQMRAEGEAEPALALPDAASGLELLSAPLLGEEVGVVKDVPARTYTAVLAVRVRSFGLLDRAEQERRLAGWGAVLASMSREASAISRVQWLERTVPADGDELGRYLNEGWDRQTVPLGSPTMQSYLELVDSAGAVTQDHELFVCLQIDAKRGWRQIKRLAGEDGADAGACALLLRELETLGERLAGADVAVQGALRPRMLARAIRLAYDPFSRTRLARLAAGDPDGAGVRPAAAWPMAADTSWSYYRTDGAVHTTYWIEGWPRTDVGATFLSPLLMQTTVLRAVSATIEPVSPLRAMREVEASITSDAADEELMRRGGFVQTARRRQRAEATKRREEELAEGHAPVRFAGYVTVSARDEEELERSCAEIEHAAQQARLELRRLYGEQDTAFTYTLPLCRGLR